MQIYTKSSMLYLGIMSSIIGVIVGSIFTYVLLGYSPRNDLDNGLYFEDSRIIDVADQVSESVVSVFSLSGDYVQASEGSGFIVDEDGLILTNKHVLVKGKDINYKVVMNNGDEYFAEFAGEDPFDDIALLKIVVVGRSDSVKFDVLEFGDSGLVRVGQKVLAFGNALAQYKNTVTMGIISGKGRQVSAKTGAAIGESENLSGLFQTDAAINLGNSGGPLVNLNGEVIGMNVAVDQSANSIGFAIPSNDLKPVVASIKKYGEVVRPVMGVRYLMLDARLAEKYGVKVDHGALLVGNVLNNELAVISGGAGEEAGLKALDVILEVDGKTIDENNPLNSVIRQYIPGDKISLKIYRAGQTMNIDLTLKSSKDIF